MKTKTKKRKRRTEDNKNLKNEHIPFLQGAVKIYGIAVRRKLPVSIACAPLGNHRGWSWRAQSHSLADFLVRSYTVAPGLQFVWLQR